MQGGTKLHRDRLPEDDGQHGLTVANNFDGRTSFTNRGFSFTTGVRF